MEDGRIDWKRPIEAVQVETGEIKPAEYLCWENGDVAAISIDGRRDTSLPHGYVDYYWRIRNVEDAPEEARPEHGPTVVSRNAALLALARLAFADLTHGQIAERLSQAIGEAGGKLVVEIDDDTIGSNFALSRAVDRIVHKGS